MIQTIISTVITFVVSSILGYCISVIKNYKNKLNEKSKEGEILKEALMTMLQSNLTNTYFVYESMQEIPDYILKNWLNSLKMYEQLGGNDYCHTLQRKIEDWKIIKTDILKQGEIMNNTNNGFDTLHLSNQIEGVRDGVYGVQILLKM